MSFVKYRVKEVAADFGMAPKDIAEIVGIYYEKPKSNSQVLTDEQLNAVFDHITQHHQIGSIAEVFAVAPAPKKAEPKPAEKAEKAPAPAAEKPAKPEKPKEPERKRERRVVDTKAVTVNADRFDDRVDSLVSERVQNYSGGKQKIGSKNRKKDNKRGQTGNKRRNEEQEKMRRLQLEIIKKTPLTVKIPDEITVGELASRMKKTATELIKVLIKNGVMASINQTIDFDTAEFVATELGCKVEKEVVVTIEDRLIDDHEDSADELQPRSPVVVVMGHVDHGKTSLLDAVRKTNVVSGEAGGITQHIGAYTVEINGSPITFLDTPGHAAFTSMRARGAMCTDIAILVVAADDGIMPQTVEAINHAKAANIPIIVAVNKMDKPGANPDRVLTQLTEHDLVPAEWGGDTEVVRISAKTGAGIDELLETVIMTAELAELKANPNRAGKGIVIEARLDKNRGPIATLLVQNGTLHKGDLIIAGTSVGRVRVMTDDKGRAITSAGPSVPVEITGLAETPAPGDEFAGGGIGDDSVDDDVGAQLREGIYGKLDVGVLRQRDVLSGAVGPLERRVPADIDVVQLDPVDGQVVEAADGGVHVVRGFTGKAEHEVRADLYVGFFRQLNGLGRGRRVVPPVDAAQGGVVQRLDAKLKPFFFPRRGAEDSHFFRIEAVGPGSHGNPGEIGQGAENLQHRREPGGGAVGIGKGLQIREEQRGPVGLAEVLAPVLPLGGEVHSGKAEPRAGTYGVAEGAARAGERPVTVGAACPRVERDLLDPLAEALAEMDGECIPCMHQNGPFGRIAANAVAVHIF